MQTSQNVNRIFRTQVHSHFTRKCKANGQCDHHPAEKCESPIKRKHLPSWYLLRIINRSMGNVSVRYINKSFNGSVSVAEKIYVKIETNVKQDIKRSIHYRSVAIPLSPVLILPSSIHSPSSGVYATHAPQRWATAAIAAAAERNELFRKLKIDSITLVEKCNTWLMWGIFQYEHRATYTLQRMVFATVRCPMQFEYK